MSGEEQKDAAPNAGNVEIYLELHDESYLEDKENAAWEGSLTTGNGRINLTVNV